MFPLRKIKMERSDLFSKNSKVNLTVGYGLVVGKICKLCVFSKKMVKNHHLHRTTIKLDKNYKIFVFALLSKLFIQTFLI